MSRLCFPRELTHNAEKCTESGQDAHIGALVSFPCVIGKENDIELDELNRTAGPGGTGARGPETMDLHV